MPENYTGVATNALPANRTAPTITLPVGGDGFSIFNIVTQVYKPVVDLLARMKAKAGFLDIASTWAEKQTFGEVEVTVDLTATAIAADAVSTETTVTAGTEFNYGTAATGHSYAQASDFDLVLIGSGTAAKSYPNDRTEVLNGGGGDKVAGRILVPGGAVITSVQFLGKNVSGAPVGLSGIYISRLSDAGNADLSQTFVQTSPGGGTASFAAGSSVYTWEPVTITPGSTMPTDGYLHLLATLPATTLNNQFRLVAVRVAYSFITVRPLT